MRSPVNPCPPAFRRLGIYAAAAALALLPVLATAAPPAGSGDRAALQHQIETLQRTAQQLDLQRQIGALRHTVQQLERRVSALEARPAPASGARSAAPPAPAAAPQHPAGARLTPQTETNWSALKHGMSADRVRALLGAPSRQVEINNGQRLWYYTYPGPRSGSVMFSRDGVVSGWQHPPFGWLW
jgi:cell division protein FtsB